MNPVGFGMAAPTLQAHAAPELCRALLRPLASTADIWCQLFSEPGAGSDLANVATSAVRDGSRWRVNGQKVWTSLGHRAQWAILLARTAPELPKHRGMTYFVLDMRLPGVTVRPLRQITGQAEFNEVFLDDVVVEDRFRVGEVGAGWQVAMTTLSSERRALSGAPPVPGSGAIADAVELWLAHHELRNPVLRDRLGQLWSRSEALRLTRIRLATDGLPGGAQSVLTKLASAGLNQQVYEFCLDLLGPVGTLYGDYSMDEKPRTEDYRGPVQQRFLRARANTVEGGSSEILRTALGERALGLPREPRVDKDIPWREMPRG
jgi:alkylation response protein AidB-like acyl-CoA dehydrogenase